MDSNIPSCGMGTTIVQSAYQKWLELHDFVPIFLKFFWGSTPNPPPLPGISKGMFWEILALLKTRLWFVSCFFWGGGGKIIPPPFLLKSKKLKKIYIKSGPPFSEILDPPLNQIYALSIDWWLVEIAMSVSHSTSEKSSLLAILLSFDNNHDYYMYLNILKKPIDRI